jgi:hypothetical protein
MTTRPPSGPNRAWKPDITRSQVDDYSYRLTRVSSSLRCIASLVLCDHLPTGPTSTLDLVPRGDFSLLIELLCDEMDVALPPLTDLANAATFHLNGADHAQ